MQQLDEANEEMAHLRARMEENERFEAEYKARVEELEREVGEKDEMIGFMSRRVEFGEESDRNGGHGDVEEASEYDYGQQQQHHHHHHYQYLNRQQEEQTGNGFGSEYLGSASKLWAEKTNVWRVWFLLFPSAFWVCFCNAVSLIPTNFCTILYREHVC